MSHDKQDSEESGEDEEIFEVESLLAMKIQKKKRVYLVRWKGYGKEHDSWEPEANLMESAGEIVEEFKAQAARRSSTTPKPLKKRPVHMVDGDEENESSSSKKSRMSRSLSKDDSKDDEDADADEDYADSKKSSSRKRAANVPMKKAQPPSKPLGAIGQSWLMESSDDDDEKKEPKNDPENDVGKHSIRRSTRSISVEKEEKRLEAREVERKAEKERKKLEKQKREEEKRKNAESFDASGSVPKLSIKMTKVDNKTDREQEGGLPPLVMKIRRAVYAEGQYFVKVVMDSEEKEIPLDEVWKLNPHGLMQHLISKYPFE